MTHADLKRALDAKTDEEYLEWVKQMGGGILLKGREWAIQELIRKPSLEPIFAHSLGLQTEAEKAVHASVSSARTAKWALWVSLFSLAFSLWALLK